MSLCSRRRRSQQPWLYHHFRNARKPLEGTALKTPRRPAMKTFKISRSLHNGTG
jgi:hypothetical protein